MNPAARTWTVRLLLVLGGVLAALGLIAGHVNRSMLDGPSFARNVDDVRRTDAVSTQLGRALSREIITARPDLIALRPLVDAVSIEVAASERLSGVVREAARSAHQALTEGEADGVVITLRDASVVVTAALAAVAPDRAGGLADVSVTLARVGDEPYAPALVTLASTMGVLAWVMPLLALMSLTSAVLLHRDRWRGVTAAGGALLAAAVSVGAFLVLGGLVVRRADRDTLSGAFRTEAWNVFVRPLWWNVVLLAAVGLAVLLVAGTTAPAGLDRLLQGLRRRALQPPATDLGTVGRAVLLGLVGLVLVLDPAGAIELVGLVAGVGLVLLAVTELGTVVQRRRPEPADRDAPAANSRSRRALPVAVTAVLVVGLLAGAAAAARPGGDVEITGGEARGEVCNGHAELCDRRYDEVAYPTSHNAMAAATEPGWFLPEQLDSIPVQLDQGVRALQIDVWSGRPAGSVVRTASDTYDEAKAIIEAELGPEVVEAALRVADAIAGVAEGPEARYLCHGLCETGATSFMQVLRQLRVWLLTNPDEVLTLILEDHVPADLIALDIEQAGLLPFVHTPVVGEPWPTLGEMIRSGRRLVVMVEAGSGGAAAPWLGNVFEHTQETPYTFRSIEELSCAPNRGPDDAPLFQMNHWLSGFADLVTSAQQVNTSEVLGGRAERCRAERGQIPNFVAVNFVAIGALYEVVDALNGVG